MVGGYHHWYFTARRYASAVCAVRHPSSTFCIVCHIYVLDGGKHFKFGT